jgi:O-antigen/teichoic acid export membrane protein
VLLARWLPAEHFGSFAVAYSVFLLAGTLHSGVVTEPMLVFGSARYAAWFREYLHVVLKGHWGLTGLGTVLLGFTGLVFLLRGDGPLASAFLGAAVATPFILFGWVVRRACSSRLQPQWAAAGGALYLLVLVSAACALQWLGLLSAFSALLLMAGASLISGLVILRRLVAANPGTAIGAPAPTDVFQAHWAYGRWAVASSGLSWIPGNLYYVLLPVFAGLEGTAAVRAVATLVLPILHFNAALGTLLLPALAAAVPRRRQFDRIVLGAFALFAGGSLAYWGLLTLYREPVVAWLYGGAYADTASLVPIMALVPLAAAGSAVLGSALRALERPQQVFWAYVVSAAVTGTAGVALMAHWGTRGAAIGLVASALVTAAACGVSFLWSRRRHAASGGEDAIR